MQNGGYLSIYLSPYGTLKPVANQGLRNDISQMQEWDIPEYYKYC